MNRAAQANAPAIPAGPLRRRGLRIFNSVASALLTVLLPIPSIADGPLERLADRVPLGAPGMVVLTDVAASVTEIAPLAADFSAADRRIMAYLPLTLVGGFEPYQAWKISTEGGLTARLGFEIEEIGQIASWRGGGDAPVVITGLPGRADTIAAALQSRGFAPRMRFGTTVWHRLRDGQTDAAHAEEDPFSQRAGYPGRFVIDDSTLLFARSWTGIRRLASQPLSMRLEPDIAAILRAGYLAKDRGRLLEVILLGPQKPLNTAVSGFYGTGPAAAPKTANAIRRLQTRGDPLPPFRRHGLLLWQNGQQIAGAVAIPYETQADVQAAIGRFPALLDRTLSLYAGGFVGGVLRYQRHFSVLRAGKRWVALLAFEETGGKFSGISPMMFVTNPFGRLREMRLSGDLPVLLSGR